MPRSILLAILLACSAPAERLPFWRLPDTTEALTKEVDTYLAAAKRAYERLLAVEGVRTIQNTLVPYDEVLRNVILAVNPPSLLADTHPDAGYRKAAQAETRKCRAFLTAFQLDPRAYRALAAIGEPGEEAFYIKRTLKQLRQMGAQLPDDTRAGIARVRAETVKLEQEFSQNIVVGRALLKIPAADLNGLPPDFLKSHPADAEGMVAVSSDRADVETVVNYSSKPALRRAALLHGLNRGYPANMVVLDRLIALRHRLAQLTGYPSYASFQLDQRMVGSVEGLRRFLDDFDRASRTAALREEGLLLKPSRRNNRKRPGSIPGSTDTTCGSCGGNATTSTSARRAPSFPMRKCSAAFSTSRPGCSASGLNEW